MISSRHNVKTGQLSDYGSLSGMSCSKKHESLENCVFTAMLWPKSKGGRTTDADEGRLNIFESRH